MRALVLACLRQRVLVVIASVVLLAVGYRIASRAEVDVFPEFAPPRVEIQTEAPGLSSLEVESLVTRPLEAVVHGVPFLGALRSKSVLGLSSVLLVFEDGTDIMQARQMVQERLGRVAAQLPATVRPPVMLPPLSSTSRVMKIGLSSATLSQTDLTDLVRFTVRPRLMAVPGVANVAVWGQRDRQLQVRVDPDTLSAAQLTVDDVVRATSDATAQAPGGFVDGPTQRLAVIHAPSVKTASDLRRVTVALRGGAPTSLGDVATVEEGFPAPIGDAVVAGGPGLLLIVEKQPWGNTVDVTKRVEAALEALAPSLKGVHLDPSIFRPATFIERAIRNLERSMAIGCGLVVVILFAFLRNLRTALISIVTIPLALVTSAALLAAFHVTMNTMVTAGLVIALGEVVDDAVIDVENILRRLRLNAVAERPRPAMDVVLDASLEVRSAVVYATGIVCLVFLPVFLLGGVPGAFFRPLAAAYVFAVGASLAIALTVTPALSLLLLPRRLGERAEPALVRGLKERYSRAVERIVRRPRAAAAIVAATLGGAAALVPMLGESFLPDFHETDFLMHWIGKPGTSLEEMQRITQRVSKELLAIPGVKNFGSHIGRAEVADEVVGPNFAELWISLAPDADYDATVARVHEVVAGYPGIERDVQTYLQERMKEVLTGASGAIVVRLFGPELGELRSGAKAVARALEGIDGVVNLKVESQSLVPQAEVRVDPVAAQLHGITPGDVRRTVSTLVQGTRVGEVYRGDGALDVVVWGTDAVRSDVTALRDIGLTTRAGGRIRLGDVAAVDVVAMPNAVVRTDAARKIDVTCDAKGRDLGAVARDVTARVAGVPLAAGHHAEVLGQHAARSDARARLSWLTALSVLGIAVLLYLDFGSARSAALVLVTLPFALVGGVLAVLCSGGVVSLGSLVGFVTVLGIAARNGILLVSHCRHLEHAEGMSFGPELVVRGAVERVVPILMTALATALALVPLVVAGPHRPGNEIEHPMALVIFGGLVTSTVLNLFLVPALYLRFGAAPRAAR